MVYGKWLRMMNKIKKHKFLSIQIIHTIIENNGKPRNSWSRIGIMLQVLAEYVSMHIYDSWNDSSTMTVETGVGKVELGRHN